MSRVSLHIFLLIMTSISYSQNIEYYIPAGFTNPLLKSGQFITSLYYYGDQITTKQDIEKIKFSRNDINFVGYLGITDKFTLKTRIMISPNQTIEEVLEGGTGENNNNFSINPEISLSYRPRTNFEVFSSVYYSSKTTQIGERGYYVEVPVIDPNTGNITYERRLATYPARPDLKTTKKTIILGFSYIGKLW